MSEDRYSIKLIKNAIGHETYVKFPTEKLTDFEFCGLFPTEEIIPLKASDALQKLMETMMKDASGCKIFGDAKNYLLINEYLNPNSEGRTIKYEDLIPVVNGYSMRLLAVYSSSELISMISEEDFQVDQVVSKAGNIFHLMALDFFSKYDPFSVAGAILKGGQWVRGYNEDNKWPRVYSLRGYDEDNTLPLKIAFYRRNINACIVLAHFMQPNDTRKCNWEFDDEDHMKWMMGVWNKMENYRASVFNVLEKSIVGADNDVLSVIIAHLISDLCINLKTKAKAKLELSSVCPKPKKRKLAASI